jgi:hypothetical protein
MIWPTAAWIGWPLFIIGAIGFVWVLVAPHVQRRKDANSGNHRLVPLIDAYRYLHKESRWRVELEEANRKEVANYTFSIVAILDVIREAALEGKIKLIGMKGNQGDYVEIPSLYWRNATVDDNALTRQSPRINSKPWGYNRDQVIYHDLQADLSEFRRVWPSDTRLRKAIRAFRNL